MVSSKVNTPKSDVVSVLLKDTFAKHFENLCNNKEAQNENFNYNCRFENALLNLDFTEEEISLCILKKTNNNKASDRDQVTNKFLKNSVDTMMPIFLRFQFRT